MRTATCQHCHTTSTTDNMVKVHQANRGGRVAYICHNCARLERGYTHENSTRRGNASHGFTFSIELELAQSDAVIRNELMLVDFMPTSDITTDCEYKSPIYQSLNPIPKKLQTLEKLLASGHGTIGAGDGTHFHVGHAEHINPRTMQYVRRFYHSLFIPLCDAMEADPIATERLFGRGFNRWASEINRYTDPENHGNFINTQHDHTLEFRLCKFQTAAQYMNCVRFCKDATNAIINNFITHFNDKGTANTREATAYRKHKANVTANKLVKLFYKYSA